jgi:hypothetical protein
MIIKFVHIIKMSWMFAWRLIIAETLFTRSAYDDKIIIVSIIAACIMVIGFNKTFVTFPIIRLLRKKKAIIAATGWSEHDPVPERKAFVPKTKTASDANVAAAKPVVVEPIAQATAPGRITGYEPNTLDARTLPKVHAMIGTPGMRTPNPGESTEYDKKYWAPVRNRKNFAKALDASGLIKRFQTVWSVPHPLQSDFKPAANNKEFDCILMTGNTVYIVDVKSFKSGDVRYYSKGYQLYCEDVPTGALIGEATWTDDHLSRITQTMQQHFPNSVIKPVVVFMPTTKGEGVIDNALWGNEIPIMNLTQFISQLVIERDYIHSTTNSLMVQGLKDLIRMKTNPDYVPVKW